MRLLYKITLLVFRIILLVISVVLVVMTTISVLIDKLIIKVMVDLSNLNRTGLGMLQTWRGRYSLEKYPEKVLLNIFYRKYTTDFMWNDIENCFQTNGQKKWTNFDLGFEKMNDIYFAVAGAKSSFTELYGE